MILREFCEKSLSNEVICVTDIIINGIVITKDAAYQYLLENGPELEKEIDRFATGKDIEDEHLRCIYVTLKESPYTEENLKPLNEFFGVTIDVEWANKFPDELSYVYENKRSIGDWDGWYSIELLLNEKISYKECVAITENLWEDNIDTICIFDEYAGKEKEDIISRLRSFLKEYRNINPPIIN